MHPSAPPSPNTQQHNSEPAHPNEIPIPNPVFASNLTAPIPRAPLINQPLVKNTFQNNNNRVHKVVRSIAPPVLNMPNISLGQKFVPNMSHWRFPQHIPSIVNQETTTVNSVPPNIQTYIAPSSTNVPLRIYQNSFLLIDMQSPSGEQQKNPTATICNVVPGLVTLVFQPTYPYVGPTPLNRSGPQVSATAPPIPDNESLTRELADSITSKKNDSMPEWKLAQYNGDPLQWHEWYSQFKSAIDSQSLTDDVKLTYLKTLFTGKAKIAIAEFAYCGLMYKDALRSLELKFGQPEAVLSAHVDQLSKFSPFKMHNSDNIINYSAAISSLVGVFKSLSYDADLKSASLLIQVVQKLTPNMKELWLLFTVQKHWGKRNLLDFNNWLKEKAESHDLMKQSATKARPEDDSTSVTKTKTASKVFASNSQERETKKQMPSSSKTLTLAALYAKVTTGYGSVEFSKKRLQPRELSLWRITNFAFRAYGTSTPSASALNQENDEQKVVIVRIAQYCMEQIGFSQQNSQQIPISFSLLATQVKVKPPLVNSRLIRPQQCHLILMLRSPSGNGIAVGQFVRCRYQGFSFV